MGKNQEVKKKLSSSKKIQQLKKTIKKSQLNIKEPAAEIIQEVQQVEEKLAPKRITVILEEAGLFLRKHNSKLILLNFEDHQTYIEKKLRRDSEIYRPDIIHQSLLCLLDSPLNKAGFLQVYINTREGQLIKINPETKIPRTYKRFAGMIAQLLERRKITTGEDNKVLLEVINSSVKEQLPECYFISIQNDAKVCDFKEFIKCNKDKEIAIVIGTSGAGLQSNLPYVQEKGAISRYQLSVTNCISKVIGSFEELYEIL